MLAATTPLSDWMLTCLWFLITTILSSSSYSISTSCKVVFWHRHLAASVKGWRHLFLDWGILLLPKLVRRGGWAYRYLRLVPDQKFIQPPCQSYLMFSKWSPVSVVFEGVKDILGVRMDKVCPGLPQWMHNVVDEPNLSKSMKKKDDQAENIIPATFRW